MPFASVVADEMAWGVLRKSEVQVKTTVLFGRDTPFAVTFTLQPTVCPRVPAGELRETTFASSAKHLDSKGVTKLEAINTIESSAKFRISISPSSK